jgi:hypothetical protein
LNSGERTSDPSQGPKVRLKGEDMPKPSYRH